MVLKIIKTIQNDKGNDKKALKRPFLPLCIVFIILIQYELINLPFYTKMDDKNDIKGKFSVLFHFLLYQPSFLNRFKINRVNFFISTER